MTSSPRLSAPEREVLAANDAFYAALRALDLARMDEVWWHDERVRCLHPGWDLIVGWEQVRQSWEKILSSGVTLTVEVSRPLACIQGDVAWVCCVEQVTSAFEGDFTTAVIETTNIFVRRAGRWGMVHHHTTPLPGRNMPEASPTVQ